jgi:hypothetical protein
MNKPNKKHIIITAVITAVIFSCLFYFFSIRKNYAKIMAVTGATPLAFKVDVKSGLSLEVSGATEKVYKFNSSSLNAFASAYLRTKEVGADGKFQGTYRYTGIPVMNILEGIAPKKPEGATFDRPLDMVVTFISSDNKQSHFSYGEVTMTDDTNPVMLAYSRTELLPTKSKDPNEPYKWNIHKGDVKGLRLICPGDSDTSRYLDDVVKIVVREIDVDNSILPVMKKGEKCKSDSVKVVEGGKLTALTLSGVEMRSIKNRVRTGHGQGYKGIVSAQGYDLISLLKKNFQGSDHSDYFLFVACDGYRTLLSGREIFLTEAGKNMMIITEVDGKKQSAGMSLGSIKDYYVDRDTWGLSHIVRVNSVDDIK